MLDGEGCGAWVRLHPACDPRSPERCAGMLLDFVSHVFPLGEEQQSAFEVFERKCRLYRALSNEEVSENLKVAVAHKNLQDAGLWKHLLRSAATLDTSSFKNEVINTSLAEAAARRNGAYGRRSGEPGQRKME